MNFITFKRACIALALIAPIAGASAATITVNQTVDLTQLNLSGGNIQKFYGGTPFTLNVGDTLNLNYDFLGNQTLIMNAPVSIFGWVAASARLHEFHFDRQHDTGRRHRPCQGCQRNRDQRLRPLWQHVQTPARISRRGRGQFLFPACSFR